MNEIPPIQPINSYTPTVEKYTQKTVKVYGDRIVTLVDEFYMYDRNANIQTVKNVYGLVDWIV